MLWGENPGLLLPLVSLILGLLILLFPKLLNIFVALYLIISGFLGLLGQLK